MLHYDLARPLIHCGSTWDTKRRYKAEPLCIGRGATRDTNFTARAQNDTATVCDQYNKATLLGSLGVSSARTVDAIVLGLDHHVSRERSATLSCLFLPNTHHPSLCSRHSKAARATLSCGARTPFVFCIHLDNDKRCAVRIQPASLAERRDIQKSGQTICSPPYRHTQCPQQRPQSP